MKIYICEKKIMKKIIALIPVSMVFFIFSGCCKKPVELGKYNLNEEVKKYLPYSSNQTFEMIHSNGNVSTLIVTEFNKSWLKEQDHFMTFCEQDYFLYENYDVAISCDYPFMNMDFNLYANIYTEEFTMNFCMNHNHNITFDIDKNGEYILDSTIIYYDTIILAEKEYYDVIEKNFDTYVYNSVDTSIFYSAFFNKKYGLIQIKTSENETYTLK